MSWKRVSPGDVVLAMLCAMYFITYVDRVNVSTAADAFKHDLGLSNTQIGLVFSAFAYPYLLFQVGGGWFGDRFGARRTLTICGLIWASATLLMGVVDGLGSMLAARVLLGFGEGATFPVATKAIATWMPASRRGFAQGATHAFARLGNTVTPPLVVMLMAAISWRGSFVVLGAVSLVWVVIWVTVFRDDPRRHPRISAHELAELPPAPAVGASRPAVPWGPLIRRMTPVTLVYFCYGWTLWTFLSWVPQYFLHNYQLNLTNSALFASSVFFAGVIGDTLGGIVSDAVLRRTGSLIWARRNLVLIGMLGSMVSSIPILFVHNAAAAVISLSLAFFFSEFTIAPMWAIPMDIAPRFAGTASGVMNTGSALAAIISPVVFGAVIDATGNWSLPFVATIGLMLVGAILVFWMHPETPLEDKVETGLETARPIGPMPHVDARGLMAR